MGARMVRQSALEPSPLTSVVGRTTRTGVFPRAMICCAMAPKRRRRAPPLPCLLMTMRSGASSVECSVTLSATSITCEVCTWVDTRTPAREDRWATSSRYADASSAETRCLSLWISDGASLSITWMRVREASNFFASDAAIPSADSARRDPSRGTRMCLNIALPSREGLVKKIHIQPQDHSRRRTTGDCRQGLVHQDAHQVFPSCEKDQGDDGEGQGEAE